MHAVSIEAGGIVPLPRVGGALSHAVGSMRNLPGHCQTGVCQPAVSERGPKAQGKDGKGQVFAGQATSCRMS
jgi:hypothetical protein